MRQLLSSDAAQSSSAAATAASPPHDAATGDAAMDDAGVSGTKRPAPSPVVSATASPVKEATQGEPRGEGPQQAAAAARDGAGDSFLAMAVSRRRSRGGAREKARKQLPFS